jgi:fluoride exporter
MMPTPAVGRRSGRFQRDNPPLAPARPASDSHVALKGSLLPFSGFVAVGLGAAAGAWLRWALGLWLNPLFPTVPLGTVSANLLGGFIIGTVMSAAAPLGLTPVARLLLITGFLGGLTTFSTFSAETTALLLQSRWAWAGAAVAVHVLGSLSMTALGVFLSRAFVPE